MIQKPELSIPSSSTDSGEGERFKGGAWGCDLGVHRHSVESDALVSHDPLKTLTYQKHNICESTPGFCTARYPFDR